MIFLSIVFIMLYSAGLIGFLRPLSDTTMLARLEPLIFVIFGYYFGRLPGYQNEASLREEIERIATKADAAQRQKELAQTEREWIEEKIRNARIALRSELLKLDSERTGKSGSEDPDGGHARSRAVETAINILNS